MEIIKKELIEVREKYGDERRTEIVYASEDFNPEDFYADEDMVLTISHMGYIKRTPLTEFRTQTRGGVGAKGSNTRDEDFIVHLYVASMHNTIVFFTESGRCFWLKVYEIPEGTRTSKGRAIQNLLNIEQEDKVKAYLRVGDLTDQEYINNNYIILCTKKGVIKKTLLEAYSRPRQNGVNAITVKDGDTLLEARMTNGNHEILMAIKSGKAIRFHESTVRPVGRTASGVRGITLAGENDEVVGMVCVEKEKEDILVVSENGYGKRSSIQDYRITNRGGKGVKTINVTEKTGSLIALLGVTDENDLMIINRSGITIRMEVAQLRIMGRATQGVRLINLKDNDTIASVAKVESDATDPNTSIEPIADIDGESDEITQVDPNETE
jgi:DNA gyrase subunit A